jgi:hypothetical protein
MDEENVGELKKCFPTEGYELDLERIKVWLLLLHKEHKDDISKILTLLEKPERGWIKDKYEFTNSCLACKKRKTERFYYSAKERADTFKIICQIFFNYNFSKITLLIFTYCLAALFGSKLNKEGFHIPFYLQIVCEKNSVVYNLRVSPILEENFLAL